MFWERGKHFAKRGAFFSGVGWKTYAYRGILSFMEIATFELEKALLEQGYGFVIGTDEAGRGPLAGPVVAAAVTPRFKMEIFKPQDGNEKLWDLVRDSKKLSEKQRERVFDFIQENFHVGIGICSHETIDRINILQASFLAMKKAITALMRAQEAELQIVNPESNPKIKNKESKIIVLVDGNKEIPNFSHEQQAVVGGDKTSKSIAAASIVAKVTRDRMMREYAQKYPPYGFEKHRGYGTKLHLDALKKYGPCEIHRKSFTPVASLAKGAKA